MTYYLTFHTVCILRENIRWLEEFIVYYLHLGFEHFYLYDNSGSIGKDGSTTQHNKYGFSFQSISTEESYKKLELLQEKYPNKITYVKWTPILDGDIVYGQEDAIRHFIKTYGNDSQWVALMDLDEFIFSPNNRNIPQYLKSLPNDISAILLEQKKFLDRFLSKELKITQEFKCMEGINTKNWANKYILKPSEFIDIGNIHHINLKYKTRRVSPKEIRFNHYNINKSQIKWMFSMTNKIYRINAYDNGMLRYKGLIEKIK